MFLSDGLLEPGVAFTELEVVFFGDLVKLEGDATLVTLKAILIKDPEKTLKLLDGVESKLLSSGFLPERYTYHRQRIWQHCGNILHL